MTLSLFFAELIGTALLIYVGAGAVALQASLIEVALAHGLVVLVFVYAYGYISGTHINPAVTLAFLYLKKISIKESFIYFTAQFMGAFVGALALKFSLLNTGIFGLGETSLAVGVSPIQGVFIEAILTFILVNTILHTVFNKEVGHLAGVAIGFSLTAAILMGAPLTGASLNPARSFGPAIIQGNLAQLWVYFAGPLLGALSAAIVKKCLSSD